MKIRKLAVLFLLLVLVGCKSGPQSSVVIKGDESAIGAKVIVDGAWLGTMKSHTEKVPGQDDRLGAVLELSLSPGPHHFKYVAVDGTEQDSDYQVGPAENFLGVSFKKTGVRHLDL